MIWMRWDVKEIAMSEFVTLTAVDGQKLGAYVTRPEGAAKGAVVVVQEIFGVNSHIRRVADGFAEEGYVVIAPALFDRIEPNVELSYEGADAQRAFADFYPKLNVETALMDIAAAYHHVAKEDSKGIGIVGFCFGGLMSWISATRGTTQRMKPSCCVGYYPGGIGTFAAEEPSCPVMLHFGATDTHIGVDQIDAVRAAHPEVEVYVYPGAGHAFNRDPDPNAYHADAAKLAMERTLAFFATHIA
jgi:carboxymethylenebutenolidase